MKISESKLFTGVRFGELPLTALFRKDTVQGTPIYIKIARCDASLSWGKTPINAMWAGQDENYNTPDYSFFDKGVIVYPVMGEFVEDEVE